MSIRTLDRFHKRPVERKNWLAMASGRSLVLIPYPLSDWSAARWWFSAQRVSLGYFRLERLIQVILPVLQLGFTETFEHIDPLLTLYIVLLCVSRCADEGLGTQKSPTRLLYWNSLCSKVSKRLKLSYIATCLGLAGDYLYIICAKGRTYLAKHILLQVIPKVS